MLISLDDSIITIEHRVKTANFLLFFGGPERDGLPRRPPGADSHRGLSWRVISECPLRNDRDNSVVTDLSHLPQTHPNPPDKEGLATVIRSI